MDGGLDDQEESVRIAVRALGDMRNSTNSQSLLLSINLVVKTIYYHIARPSGHTSDLSSDTNNASPAFVERMSHIPFVNSALRVYEQGKASSRMVKVCPQSLLPEIWH